MRFHSVTLVNFCQYRGEHTFELPSGTIGVLGPNGYGKSNLMAALYIGLTGDFTRLVGTREANVNRQAADDAPSLIRLDASHAGVRFQVTRNLRTGAHSFQAEGESKPITGARAVESRLSELLQVSRKVLDEYVFVGQWQMFSILADNPAARKDSLMRMCRLHELDSLFTLVDNQGKKFAASSEAQLQELVRQYDGLTSQLTQQRSLLEQDQQQWMQATQAVPPEADRSRAAQTLAFLRERRQVLSNLNQVNQLLSQLSGQLAGLQPPAGVERLPALQQELQSLNQELASLRGQQQAQLPLQQAYNSYQTRLADVQRRLAHCRVGLQSATQSEPRVWDANPERAELEMLQGSQDAQIASLQQTMLTLLQRPGTKHPAQCPCCLQSTAALSAEQWQGALQTCLQAYSQGLARITELKRLIQQQERDQLAHQDWSRRVEQCKREAAEAQASYLQLQAEAVPAAPPDLQADITAALGRVTAKQQEIQQLEQAQANYGRMRQNLESQLQSQQTHQASLSQRLQAPELQGLPADDQLDVFDQYLVAADHAVRSANAAQVSVGSRQNQIQYLEQQLADNTARRQNQPRIEAWGRRLSAMGQQLHRDGLPTVMLGRVLQHIQQDINSNLCRFGGNFLAEIDSNADFVACFSSGMRQPAQRLSGAQQMIMSLSIRLALYDLFQPQLGALILDEPTAGMDAKNVTCLEQVFAELSIRARDQNTQVLVVTHAEALRRSFDAVLELTGEGEGQVYVEAGR